MKAVKAKTTKAAAKVAPKGTAAKADPKAVVTKGQSAKAKKPAKVLPKGTRMSLDDTLWRLVNRPIPPKKPVPADKAKAEDES